MPSLLHFQIIVDIVFFAVIMLLLRQLHKRMAKYPPAGPGATVGELRKLVRESQDSADLFLRTLQDSEERLNKLARQLDNQEKRIVIVLEKAESLLQKLTFQQEKAETLGSDGEKYGQIIGMIQEGLCREEVANRLGVAMGEIDLVMELEQAREAAHKRDISE